MSGSQPPCECCKFAKGPDFTQEGSSLALPRSPVRSIEEYLTEERASLDRHEYLDGQVYLMAGESLQHSQICVNISREISTQLKDRDCQVLSPNMKVKTGDSRLFSYPDVTVVCGQPLFHDAQTDVLINPVIIIEVLSPSTEAYDRGEKFFRYRGFLPSLMEYLLVSQHRPLVERYVRQGDGQWLCLFVEGLSQRVDINAIGCPIELSEIYSRVNFPEGALPSPDGR